MIEKLVDRYKKLYAETDLSTSQITSQLSAEFKLAEMTVDRMLRNHGAYREFNTSIPVRHNDGGGKRRTEIIPIERLVEIMEKHLQKYPVNRAAQLTAVELGCGRSNVLTRYNRHKEREFRSGGGADNE